MAQSQISTGSYGATLTSGIQDISSLLPILGTEQCDDLAGSALSDGFLFAAATTLSIFGTLGLAMAGFKAAFASIVIPSWGFLGAEKLRDAGFKPSGKNLELITMDPSNRDRYYLIETRLCERLEDLHFENNGQVRISFDWEGLRWWNVKMAFATAAFCVTNLTAYIELILHDDNHLGGILQLTFRITRILGSFLAVVSLQILIRCRITNIIRARELFGRMENVINFMRASHHSRDLRGLNYEAMLDATIASDECLSRMRRQTDSHILGCLRDIFHTLLKWLSGRSHPDNLLGKEWMNSREELTNFIAESANYRVTEWPFIVLTLVGSFGCVVGYIGCFSIVQGYAGSL